MINECASIGGTIINSLQDKWNFKQIIHKKNILDKSFGMITDIIRSKADIYHSHFLLQHTFLPLIFNKRPLIGHGHGTDIRDDLDKFLRSKIVKFNLKRCDRILTSTPDIFKTAKEYREDAIYLPNPIDLEYFHPKEKEPSEERTKVLIAGKLSTFKGSQIAIRALSQVKEEVEVSVIKYGVHFNKLSSLAQSLGLELNILQPVHRSKIRELYWNHDVIMDQFIVGCPGMVSLEAISCGTPSITHVSSDIEEYEKLPIKGVNSEEKIIEVLKSHDLKEIWKKQYEYVKENHNLPDLMKQVDRLYKELL